VQRQRRAPGVKGGRRIQPVAGIRAELNQRANGTIDRESGQGRRTGWRGRATAAQRIRPSPSGTEAEKGGARLGDFLREPIVSAPKVRLVRIRMIRWRRLDAHPAKRKPIRRVVESRRSHTRGSSPVCPRRRLNGENRWMPLPLGGYNSAARQSLQTIRVYRPDDISNPPAPGDLNDSDMAKSRYTSSPCTQVDTDLRLRRLL